MKKLLLFFVFVSCIVQNSIAQVLCTYTGSGGNSTAVVPGGPNETVTSLQNSGFGSNTPCQSGGLSGITVSTGYTTYTTSGPRVFLTITPINGYSLNMTGITAGLRESNTGPARMRLAYSLDGGTTWIDDGLDHVLAPGGSCGSNTDYNWDGTLNVTNITGSVIVAIFPFLPNNSSGTFQVNSIIVNGDAVLCTPPSDVVIAGPSVLCPLVTSVFTVTATGGNTYQWYENGNPLTGATQTTYTVTSAGTYLCTVKDLCNDSVISNTITVTAPVIPSNVLVSGQTMLCSGGSNTLSVTSLGGTVFQWKKNNIAISGATNSTVVVNLAGVYTCVVKNACGDSVTSNILTLTVGTPPSSAVVSGNNIICTGLNDTLTITAIGGNIYQWKRNNIAISGATNATCITNLAGAYTCTVKNTCGDSLTSNTINVIPGGAPANPAISGNTVVCSGSYDTLLASALGGTIFKWEKNNTPIAGATNASYFASAVGAYICIIKNICGDSSVTNSISVAVSAIPVASFSNTNVNTAYFFVGTAAGATSWHWNFGDGGTSTLQNPEHNYTAIGNYTVTFTATNAAGCSNTVTSVVHVTSILGVNNIENGTAFSIAPNPAVNNILLNISNTGTGTSATLRITDITGKTLITQPIALQSGIQAIPVNVSVLPSGSYLVNLLTADANLTQKLVILK